MPGFTKDLGLNVQLLCLAATYIRLCLFLFAKITIDILLSTAVSLPLDVSADVGICLSCIIILASCLTSQSCPVFFKEVPL